MIDIVNLIVFVIVPVNIYNVIYAMYVLIDYVIMVLFAFAYDFNYFMFYNFYIYLHFLKCDYKYFIFIFKFISTARMSNYRSTVFDGN